MRDSISKPTLKFEVPIIGRPDQILSGRGDRGVVEHERAGIGVHAQVVIAVRDNPDAIHRGVEVKAVVVVVREVGFERRSPIECSQGAGGQIDGVNAPNVISAAVAVRISDAEGVKLAGGRAEVDSPNELRPRIDYGATREVVSRVICGYELPCAGPIHNAWSPSDCS